MCTSLLTFDADGKAYLGRGIEYSRLMPTQISYMPVGTAVASLTPEGKQGKTFSTQYPILAFVGQSIPEAKFPAVFQGANDQGLSFGAQTLVKDYISGIFLIVEDQYGIGDEVEIGTVRGKVEGVALRTTRVRDEAGVLWYIRNGEILNVANFSQNTTWEK